MATLFRVGRHRILVYTNDHSPAHVHAVGAGGYAKFAIGRSPDDVTLIDTDGISSRDLQRIASEIIDHHAECLAGWERYHGNEDPDRSSS